MGVSIHWKLSQTRQEVKPMLDRAQYVAEGFKKTADALGMEFEIRLWVGGRGY